MITEVILFICAVVFINYVSSLYSKEPPGPWGLPLVGYMPFLTDKPHVKFIQLAKKYGDVFSVTVGSHRAVVLNSASVIREALKIEAFSGRPNLYFFTVRSWGRRRGVLFADGSEWHEQRRFILRNLRDLGFGKKSMEGLIADEALELRHRLREHVDEPLELRNIFNVAVFNSLWTLVAGDKLAHDDKRANLFIQRLTRNVRSNHMNGVTLFMEWLAKLFPATFNLPPLHTSIEGFHGFFKELIDGHRATYNPDSIRDLIDLFIREIKNCTDEDSSFYGEEADKTLMTVLLDLFVAGTETTSTTMTAVMRNFVRNPRVQAKVHEEIDRVVGRDRLPSLSDRPSMPYTEAVIMETSRCNTILPLSVFHATTEDVEFNGYQIPKNTVVFANTYAAMHDSRYWENPEEFIPERFLSADGHSIKRHDGYMPFSAGKRQCLGESLAKDSLFLFMTTLMQMYEVTPVQGEPIPSIEDEIGLVVMPKPFKIVLKERVCGQK